MNAAVRPELMSAADSPIPFWRRATVLPFGGGLPEFASIAGSQPAPSLLLVDDDPGVIQVLGHMLDGLGHVRFALSAGDALNLASE